MYYMNLLPFANATVLVEKPLLRRVCLAYLA